MLKKRLLTMLLCLVLIASLFTACGKSGTNAEKTDGSDTSPLKENKEETVTIVMERPLWQNADPSSDPNMRIRQKIKEKINIDVEVVGQQNPPDQAEKPNLMIAAGETLDIFQTPFGGSNDWRKYKREDTIIPLNDLLNEFGVDLLKHVNQDALKACTDEDGKIWALPDEQNPVTTFLMMRKDWLDKYNLSVPETFEEYENVLQVFKEKENDEGIVPFWQGLEDNIFAGCFIPTGDQKFLDSDGKLKPNFMHPNYKEFLAKMADWYKKGFLHKEFATMQYQQAADLAFGGRSGLFVNWISGSFKFNVDTLKNSVPDGELIVIAPPKGPAGRLIRKGLPITSNIMITKSSKYPEKSIEFLNWSMATDEGWLLSRFGEEGYDWNWIDKSKNILDYTDKKVDVDRYGYAIFCSTRLNKFVNKYNIGGMVDSEATAFVHDENKYPTKNPIDLLVIYDVNKMKSKDKLNSMNTFLNEAKYQIIMGQEQVSSWDNVIKKWLELGGKEYIDDITEQFNAQK
ncbi:MAG TPA: extracellular solute-binding protein [Clostridiales bacterium]|nr:extracellular solute-binding protein [Clostridiales bacterium]